MQQTNKVMAGVTAAMLLGSPGASLADAAARNAAEGEMLLAQNRTASGLEEAEEAVASLLDDTPSTSAKSLDELMSKMPGTSKEVVQQAIDNLMIEDQIHRVGVGTAGDPYRYWAKMGYRP